MLQFIGHFHPVLVHLPIGILLIGCVFQWLVVKDKYKKLTAAVGITLFWGMIFSVLSCITGYLLSLSGEYEGQLVTRHQYLGIAVALVSILLYYLYKRSINLSFSRWLALILAALIVITGHMGGSLTHGEDYLSFSPITQEEKYERKAIADVQAAKAYDDVVKPILQEKCYSCHSVTKQKGKLRLDLPEFIQKGGKEGNTLVSGDPEKSEMIKRLLLPRNEEHHMPPKEKPQLTENEVALLHWWVQTGASFDKTVKDLSQLEKMKPILTALQNPELKKASIADIPESPVNPTGIEQLSRIRARGITIMPVSQNCNYLQASFINTETVTVKDIELLVPVKEQLVWLKLSNHPIDESAAKVIGQLTKLVRLQLDNTKWNDAAMNELKSLKNLQHLNLVRTFVTEKGIMQLAGSKNLRTLYVYQSKIDFSNWSSLQSAFPSTKIDSGGYLVPTLESDTTIVKESKTQ